MPYLIKKIKSADNILLSYQDQLPFDLTFSTHLTLANAVNLAFLSNLAYSDFNRRNDLDSFIANSLRENKRSNINYQKAPNFRSPFVKRKIDSSDLRLNYDEITNQDGFNFKDIPETDTQYIFYQTGNEIVISIRGTQQGQDWLTDANAMQIRFAEAPVGRVHSGFYSCFQSIKPEIDRLLQGQATKNIFITGHSLGGAIATLVSAYIREKYSNEVMLYTFGSPRVGDRIFVDYFTNKKPFTYYRFVNSNDVVTMAPPPPHDFGVWACVPVIRLLPLSIPLLYGNPEKDPYLHMGKLVFIGRRNAEIVDVIDISDRNMSKQWGNQSADRPQKTKSPEELRSLMDGISNLASDHNMEKYLSIITTKLHYSIKRYLFSEKDSNSDATLDTKPALPKQQASMPADITGTKSGISYVATDNDSPEQLYTKIINRPFDSYIKAEFEYQIGGNKYQVLNKTFGIKS